VEVRAQVGRRRLDGAMVFRSAMCWTFGRMLDGASVVGVLGGRGSGVSRAIPAGMVTVSRPVGGTPSQMAFELGLCSSENPFSPQNVLS
jgi:hypothetical protein